LFLNSSLPDISGSTFNGSTSAGNQVFNNAASPSPAAAEGTPLTGGSSSPEAPATSSAAEHTPAGGGSINVGKWGYEHTIALLDTLHVASLGRCIMIDFFDNILQSFNIAWNQRQELN